MRGTHAFRGLGAAGLALGTLLAGAVLAQPAEVPAAAPAVDPALETAVDPGVFPEGPAKEAAPAAVPAPRPPAPRAPASLLEVAWRTPASDLADRVQRTRRTALGLGAWNLDPAARALGVGRGRGLSLESASAAVELAPDLPAARMRLAQALWLQGDSPMAAVRAVLDALVAIGRHPEASVWFAGSLLYVLAVTLVGGGLLAIALAGLAALPHAAHDTGHALPGRAPHFARSAALAALLLVPVALGEGILGLALGLLAIAVAYGSRAQRVAMTLAIACVGLGAYPVAQLAGSALSALPADPVAGAAYGVGHGLATPVDLARLEAAADDDPLAARGLAIHARRVGQLGEADALYQRLLRESPDDLALLNNAANVRLDLGHMERALELYRRAVEIEESPVVLFNLAQAYGRAFQVEDLNRTLSHAQEVGGELVAELTTLQGTEAEGFVVDFPLAPERLWSRALRSGSGAPVAAGLRAPVAPGRLGASRRHLAASALAVVVLGALAGRWLPRSRWCSRCGSRMCPRCSASATGGELCEACHRLFFQPDKTDRARRVERVNELRARERRMGRVVFAVSLLLPGAAGLLARRPVRALFGALCFALAVTSLLWREGVTPDPLVAGAAAAWAFLGIATLALLGYAGVVASSLAARKEE